MGCTTISFVFIIFVRKLLYLLCFYVVRFLMKIFIVIIQ